MTKLSVFKNIFVSILGDWRSNVNKKTLCISTVALATVMFLATSSFGQNEDKWPNVVFTEDFEDGDLEGWKLQGNVALEREHAHKGKAVRLGPVGGTSGINRLDVKPDADQVYIVFWMMQTLPTFNSLNVSYTRMNFNVVQGTLSPVAKEDVPAIDVPIQRSEWHQIGVAIDYSRGYDLYFDDLSNPVKTDIPFEEESSDKGLHFVIGEGELFGGLVYLDDIVVGKGEMLFAVSSKEKIATMWGNLKACY